MHERICVFFPHPATHAVVEVGVGMVGTVGTNQIVAQPSASWKLKAMSMPLVSVHTISVSASTWAPLHTFSFSPGAFTLLFLISIVLCYLGLQKQSLRAVLGFDVYLWFILHLDQPHMFQAIARHVQVEWILPAVSLVLRLLTLMMRPVQNPVPRSNQSLFLSS